MPDFMGGQIFPIISWKPLDSEFCSEYCRLLGVARDRITTYTVPRDSIYVEYLEIRGIAPVVLPSGVKDVKKGTKLTSVSSARRIIWITSNHLAISATHFVVIQSAISVAIIVVIILSPIKDAGKGNVRLARKNSI